MLRDDRAVGDAHFESAPCEFDMRQAGSRAARGFPLAKAAAVGIAVLSVALCAGAVALLSLAPAHHAYGYDLSGDLAVGSLFPIVGALIAVREPPSRG